MARNEKVTIFLKDCIADALLTKMKEKQFDKITADEIIAAADVGRMTYFRNFSSKQDILTYKIIRLWETESEQRDLRERRKFDINNAIDFFEINYSFKEIFDLIYSSGLQSTLLNAFYKIMVPSTTENDFQKYRERFYAYGLFGLLDEWIISGYKETPKQMAEMLIKIHNKEY